MTDSSRTTRHLPFLADVPARVRRSLEQSADQLDGRHREADASRAKAAETVSQEFHRDLRKLLGASGLAELRTATESERLALRDLQQPPRGLGADHTKARKAADRRIDAVVRRLGARPGQLRKLGADYERRLLESFAPTNDRVGDGYHLESNLDKWRSLSALHAHPVLWGMLPPEDLLDPHRSFVFRPPFFGFLFSFWYQGSDDFRAERDLHLDPQAGWVGNTIRLDSDDGDFGEHAQARADAQIAFGFVPPVAGIVEVVVNAQSLAGRYDLRVRDNFGFSDASAAQFNYLVVSLLNPGAPEHLVTRMDESHASSDGEDISPQGNHLSRLQHYFAGVVSSAPVRAGETVVIAVGTRSVDIGRASHMDFHSESDFQWFISSVGVRIVP